MKNTIFVLVQCKTLRFLSVADNIYI